MDEVECNGFCFLLRSFLKSISFPSPSLALPSLSLTSVIDLAYCFFLSHHLSVLPLFLESSLLSVSLSHHRPSSPLPILYFQPSPHLFSSTFRFRSLLLISSSSLSSYNFSPVVSLYKFLPFSSPRSSPQFNRSRFSLVLSTFLSISPLIVLYPSLHLF